MIPALAEFTFHYGTRIASGRFVTILTDKEAESERSGNLPKVAQRIISP